LVQGLQPPAIDTDPSAPGTGAVPRVIEKIKEDRILLPVEVLAGTETYANYRVVFVAKESLL
jgi:hypothetical protein